MLPLVAVKQAVGQTGCLLSSSSCSPCPETNALLEVSLLTPNPSEAIVGKYKIAGGIYQANIFEFFCFLPTFY